MSADLRSLLTSSSVSYSSDDRHSQRIVRLRADKPLNTSSALPPPVDDTAAAPATPQRRQSTHMLTTPTSIERSDRQRAVANGQTVRVSGDTPAAAVDGTHPERALQLMRRESLTPDETPDPARHEKEKLENLRHEQRPDSRKTSGIEKVIYLSNGTEIDRWQPTPRQSPSSDVRPKAFASSSSSSSSSRAVLIDHRTATGPNAAVSVNKANKLCRYFARGPRACHDGDRCLFLHELPASAVLSRHRSISTDNDHGVAHSPPSKVVKSARAEFEAAARALEKAAVEKAAQEKASSGASPPADKDDLKAVNIDPDRPNTCGKPKQPEKPKAAEPNQVAAEQRTVCVIFQSLGDCPFGSGCPDLHHIATPEPVLEASRSVDTSPSAPRMRRVSLADVVVVDNVSRPRPVSPVGPPRVRCNRWKEQGKCPYGNKCYHKEGHLTTRSDERKPAVKRVKLTHSSPSPTSQGGEGGGHANGIRRAPSPARHRSENHITAHDSPRSRLTSRDSSPVDERTCGRWERFGHCHFGDKCYHKNTHYPPGTRPAKTKKRSRSPSPASLWIKCDSREDQASEISPSKRLREIFSTTTDDVPHSRHTSSSNSPNKAAFCSRWQRTGSCVYGVNCHYRSAHIAPTAESPPMLKKVQVSRASSPERRPSSSSSSPKPSRKDDDLERPPRKVLVYCRQMEMTGQCQFGKRCWYSHDIPKRPQKPQIQVVERVTVKSDDKSSVDDKRAEGNALDASDHGSDVMQIPLDVENRDAQNNRASSPSNSEQHWDAYTETWGALELTNGSYPRIANGNRRWRTHSGGSRGPASAVDGQLGGNGADASNSGSSMAARSRESTVDGERATAAIPLTRKYFSLHKGQGVFVATVQLVNVVMTSTVERDLAQELEQDGALCVAHMAPMDHMQAALQEYGNDQPHDHAAIIAVLPSQTEGIKTVATYLTIAKKAGVVTLKNFTLFILPAADARSLFNIDVDGKALLHCIAMRSTGTTPGTLKTFGMSRTLNLASPFLASVEFRRTYLQTTHGLPEKFQWLVDGRSVFILSPDELVPTAEMRWLVTSHGGRLQDEPRADCDLILCHRQCHNQIGKLPNLLALKKRGTEFVLWGHSTASSAQRAMQLFPGAGGIVTLTQQSLESADGLELLRCFADFTKGRYTTEQWLCILHPHLVDTCKSSSAHTAGTIPQPIAAQAMFYIGRLEAAGCLIVATEGQVYDEKAHLTGPVREFALLVRLQIQWSLNFRNFVLLTTDDRRDVTSEGSAGILEMTAADFMRCYRMNRTVELSS
ncbi:hypothetical protein HDU87_002747 [Geranomyces variabilis]|uniref:C3H1-type domain-containing protein n=1 Tax=Geranomyces variabilis TaxID=109894 RepID=A0AAD5XU00_9FUNG|nr:hypothetical protein HDU87_002747 [Geranomyces variabilis]